jgi:uncharacterized membrane protein
MFVVHSAYPWLAKTHHKGPYYGWLMEIAGIIAPVFMFLAGVSIVVLARRARGDELRTYSLKRRVALRGAQILALGYALRFAFWYLDDFRGSWTRILKVDILQCIGVGLIVFPWLAWPKKKLNLPALLLFFAFPVAHLVFFQLRPEQWLHAGLAAYLTTSPKLAAFPFVPYGMWIAFGLFVGGLCPMETKEPKREAAVIGGLAAGAVLLFVLSYGVEQLAHRVSFYRLWGEAHPYKGLLHGFLAKGSWVLVSFGVFRAVGPAVPKLPFSPLATLGRSSLFCYCTHLFVIYHVAGRFLKHELSPAGHLVGGGVLTVAMVSLAFGWKRWPVSSYLAKSWRRVPLPRMIPVPAAAQTDRLGPQRDP